MKKITLVLLFPFLIGCASSYKTLRPNMHSYQTSKDYSGLEFSYRMGILRERHNKKYAKREDLNGIQVVAVRLVNNTAAPLTVGKDFNFYSGNVVLPLIEPSVVQKELKQGVPIYLLYLLMSPLQLYTADENGDVNATPIGLFLGPGLAFGNMIGAGAANQNFLRELVQYSIIDKTIEPGQTIYGLIGIGTNGYNPIEIKLKDYASLN